MASKNFNSLIRWVHIYLSMFGFAALFFFAVTGITLNHPGYNADAFIERSTGQYDLTVTSAGFIAVLNDLHKGSDTGTRWATVIDISAIIMIFVSVTGFVMIFCLSKRKLPGLIVAAIGALTFIVLCIVLN